ncbi:MAG: hypothetical protein ACE5L6_07925 [Candidatus Bathyarchaeia archaeon]
MILAVLMTLLYARIAPLAKSAYTGIAKPMEFCFHYIDTPVTVAGLQTKYIMNTTREYRFSTQQEAFENSLYKPVGLPKIVMDFYLYPNLAGPVTINGTWQVFVWLNGSAYKPVTFSLVFKEITAGGEVLWNSGQLSPTVTSSIGGYIDVPVYNYNLSVPLAHSFNAGTTILVEFEVNAGSSADTRFWFDSSLYPSKVILPAEDYARPISIKTYSIDGRETTLFHYNWSESWRRVIVRANVTDPFGGYDVNEVSMTILDPSGYPVLEETKMVRLSDGQWRLNYLHTFEANWSYPIVALLGNYSVIVTVVDNNGYYHNLSYGSAVPFIEEAGHIFKIGVLVYYDPAFIVVDDVDDPLPDAQVYVTWTNGTTDKSPRYTSADGWINLTRVLAGNYGFTILWKDVVVAHTTVYVDSDGPYTIRTQVYRLIVHVFGNNGAPIYGSYVIVNTELGVGYGLDISDQTGTARFKLPSGEYIVSVHYTTAYCLTVVRASASEQVIIEDSASRNIVLNDFPPPIWSTTLFWLLLLSVLAAAVAVVVILYVRRRV